VSSCWNFLKLIHDARNDTHKTRTHITKTPTYLSKHQHITNPTHAHYHILQNKIEQPQYKMHTKQNNHNTANYTQYVALMCMVLLSPKGVEPNLKINFIVFISVNLVTIFDKTTKQNFTSILLLRLPGNSDKS
jgi:hypothetical protein